MGAAKTIWRVVQIETAQRAEKQCGRNQSINQSSKHFYHAPKSIMISEHDFFILNNAHTG